MLPTSARLLGDIQSKSRKRRALFVCVKTEMFSTKGNSSSFITDKSCTYPAVGLCRFLACVVLLSIIQFLLSTANGDMSIIASLVCCDTLKVFFMMSVYILR